MLYIETSYDEISKLIDDVNGRMTEGRLNPDFIGVDLERCKKTALDRVSENQFYGSIVTLRSRFGRFPKRYKYRVQGVAVKFKYTKKGWAFISCERTEDYPDQYLPEWIIIWSTKASEALQKKAEKAYEEMLQNARYIQG